MNSPSETDDTLLKRIFIFLPLHSNLKDVIEDAIYMRLNTIIPILSIQDLIKYDIFNLDSIKLDATINEKLNSLSEEEIKEILQHNPSKRFKEIAITLFTESQSFDSAYINGNNYLIPYIHYLTDEELKVLFEKIKDNSSYSINQILHAHGMDGIFCEIYEITKNHIVTYQDSWLNFWELILAYQNNFSSLKELLIQDNIIDEE